MNRPSLIGAYMAELRRRLKFRTSRVERILLEAENHLDESARALESEGLPREVAEREALVRFGTPEEVAARFESELQDTEEIPMLLKLATTVTAGVTTLVSTVVVFHSMFFDIQEGEPLWVAQKILAGSAVAALGALTLAWLWSDSMRESRLETMLRAGALGLFPVGLLTISTTVQLGRQTGDWEMYMIAAGAAMLAQGALTLWRLHTLKTA
jgi:hypothetical protein